jgi:outer membrane protein
MRGTAHPLAALALLTLAAASRAAPGENPAGVDGPLTLEQAVAVALAHQPQLQAARAQTRAARARVGQATAPLLPQVSGGASYGHAGGSGLPASSRGESWSAGLAGSQLLFDFGQGWFGRAAASASARAEAEAERDTTHAVVLSVRGAWFTAAAARDLVAVARGTVANREAHLRQIQGFVEVGTRPEIDLAQARSDLASARVLLINQQNNLATSLAQLNQAMGVVGTTDYALAPTAPPAVAGEDGALEPLVSEALSSRGDLAALQHDREAQVAALRSLRASYAPSISATGRVDESGPAATELSPTWNVGVALTWPLLTGGRTRAQVNEAEATLEVLDAQAQQVRLQVRLAVEQAWLSVKSAKAALEATGEAVTSAHERLRLAEARYQAGLGSGIELDDAQVAETTAAAQEVQARFNLATARAELVRALGRG